MTTTPRRSGVPLSLAILGDCVYLPWLYTRQEGFNLRYERC